MAARACARSRMARGVPTAGSTRRVRPARRAPCRSCIGGKDGASGPLPGPPDDPLARAALTQPVAFLGGLVAGALRIDLNEEPLREWVRETAAAAGAADGAAAQPPAGSPVERKEDVAPGGGSAEDAAARPARSEGADPAAVGARAGSDPLQPDVAVGDAGGSDAGRVSS